MSTLPLIFGIGVRDRYGATTGPANDSREGGSQLPSLTRTIKASSMRMKSSPLTVEVVSRLEGCLLVEVDTI